MIQKASFFGATVLIKIVQIVLAGIAFGESIHLHNQFNNCDFIGLSFGSVLITFLIMEVVILIALYCLKPIGTNMFNAELVSVFVLLILCLCYSIFHWYEQFYDSPEDMKKLPVPPSALIITLLVIIFFLQVFVVVFAERISKLIDDEIQAPEQADMQLANDPENAAVANVPENAFPANDGQNIIPANEGQNLVPANEGQNLVPANEGQNLVPANEGQNLVPANEGQNLVPANEGQNLVPANEGQNLVPANEGQNLVPANEGQNIDPANDQIIVPENDEDNEAEQIDNLNATKNEAFNASTARLDDPI